jgi:N-acyl-phosphatidylethanolamine-hydrolysing phospholipase D
MPNRRRTRWAGCLAAGALALAGPASAQAPNPASFGPAPRDAEGRFLNLAGELPRAGIGVVLPFQLRRIASSIAGRPGAPQRVANDGAFLRENARHSVPTATWIGHSTLLVQMGGTSFLTDPIWSPTASPVSWLGPRRFTPPGLELEALPPIDFVLISHSHYDHLDLPTLIRVARKDPDARFLVPLGNAGLLREAGLEHVEEFDWGQGTRVGRAEVTCVPSQHWSQRSLSDARRSLWCAWVVRSPERTFYFMGDSGWYPGFADVGRVFGPIDLAAVAIGAYQPTALMRPHHVDPEEAVRAGRALAARRLVAMHFGTFDLSDEPLDEPPARFRAAAAAAGYAESDAWVLRIGETRDF